MTEDQKSESIRLYRAGVRIATIPRLIGSTQGSVERYLYKTVGVASRNKVHKVTDIHRIEELRKKGLNGVQIRNELGIDRNQLNYILRKHGLSLKKMDNSNKKILEKMS
jgi:hypothetical protein